MYSLTVKGNGMLYLFWYIPYDLFWCLITKSVLLADQLTKCTEVKLVWGWKKRERNERSVHVTSETQTNAHEACFPVICRQNHTESYPLQFLWNFLRIGSWRWKQNENRLTNVNFTSRKDKKVNDQITMIKVATSECHLSYLRIA